MKDQETHPALLIIWAVFLFFCITSFGDMVFTKHMNNQSKRHHNDSRSNQ